MVIQTGQVVVTTPKETAQMRENLVETHTYLFIFVKIAGRADFALFQNLLSICSDCTSTIL